MAPIVMELPMPQRHDVGGRLIDVAGLMGLDLLKGCGTMVVSFGLLRAAFVGEEAKREAGECDAVYARRCCAPKRMHVATHASYLACCMPRRL